MMPFLIVKATHNILGKSVSYNAIKTNKPLTGKKKGAYTNDLNIDEVKTLTKSLGCTLNDYMISLISNTLYEYFDNRKQDWNGVIPKTVNVGMPFSLRAPAAKLEDVRIVNEFVSYPVTLPIVSEIEDVLPEMQKFFKNLRTSLDPFGALNAFCLLVNHPFTLPKYLLDSTTDKYHIFFTNLNASKIPYTFGGKKQLGQFYYCTGVGKICNGISIATTGKIMSFACYADLSQIEYPQEIVDIFLRKHKAQLKKLENGDGKIEI